MTRLVVAIDGPAASGKGTLARRLAARFNLAHLDTGALYRATARDVLAAGEDPRDAAAAAARAAALDPGSLADPRLRGEEIGRGASLVAAHPSVRAALLDFQRRFAAHPPGAAAGAVLDGRDIGTVICPEAAVKLFVTASPEERARRRCLELEAKGEAVERASVLAEIRARDARDAGRDVAPLAAAADAVTLDTSTLDADAVFALAEDIVARTLRG